MPFRGISLSGLTFAAVTEAQAVNVVRRALERGEGGWIFTPNVDILRQLRQSGTDVGSGATLVVADGAPVVWASRLAGTPLPARVAGSDLVWSLARMAAAADRSVFVLGGEPPAGARQAQEALAAAYPGLRIAGAQSPPYRFDRDSVLLDAIRKDLVEAKPDLVYVGLGFPRQERLIEMLRPDLPAAWFLGCGGAINFLAGDRRRAPVWMRRAGLEWLHRLATEPRRLGRRYLRDDAPFAMRLLARAARARMARWSYRR
jgi:N-acetylglucosaminyldiphosphoundecaprenol N-acetyl-beta-D-mannosaminyltransferase